jgi:GNAT superfamily N-acetyltransferase
VLAIRVLDPCAEEAAIQALFEQDPGFFELTEGAPPRSDEARQTFALPPELAGARQHVFAIGEPLAGVIEMLEGYPDLETWYLGLIFLAPHARGAGLGAAALEWLCAHVAAAGGRKLRLACTVGNTRARQLYDRLGFALVYRKPRTTWCGVVIECDVLERATACARTTG